MKTIYLSRTKSGKLSLTLAAAALLAGTAVSPAQLGSAAAKVRESLPDFVRER